jgi:hypothetical protein
MGLDSILREMKNIEQLNCPHCTVLALFNFSTPKALSNIEIREAQCQGCGGIIVQIRNVNYELTPKSPCGGFKSTKNAQAWDIVWPRERVICSDVRIPEEIRDDLNKACTIVDISPDAAAGLTRRSLERLLRKYLNLNGRDLDALITNSKEILHPRIFAVLDAVRRAGNFGAHLKEDAQTEEIFFVEKEEALLATKAVLDLASEWFIHKIEAEEFLKKIESKTQRTRKNYIV